MNRPYPVSKVFRELCLNTYPALQCNESYRKLFVRLLFGTEMGDDFLLPLPAKTLAEYEGKMKQYEAKNYNSKPFIDGFMDAVFPILFKCEDGKREWKHYPTSDKYNQCRMVESFYVEDCVSEAFSSEIRGQLEFSQLVEFVSGKPVTPKVKRTLAEKSREEMLSRLNEANCEEAREVVEYMAGRSAARLSKIIERNLHLLEERLAKAYPEGTENYQLRRDIQMSSVSSIRVQPTQGYGFSNGTTRISPNSLGLCTVAKVTRQTLTTGCYEIDIHHSQLSIASKLWELPILNEYLSSGKNLWDDLMLRTKASNTNQRSALKDATYAALYGAAVYQHHNSRYTLAKLAGKKGINDNSIKGILDKVGLDFKKFTSHPVIREVLKARSKQLKKIEDEGGAFDSFGRWLKYSRNSNAELGVFSATSILAQVSQSWELKIMVEAVRLAKESPDRHGFEVLLWQHDGVTVDIDDKTEVKSWLRRINERISSKAAEFGFNITTEATEL